MAGPMQAILEELVPTAQKGLGIQANMVSSNKNFAAVVSGLQANLKSDGVGRAAGTTGADLGAAFGKVNGSLEEILNTLITAANSMGVSDLDNAARVNSMSSGIPGAGPAAAATSGKVDTSF